MQLGFQSLGSSAVPEMRRLIADGAIGEPVRFGALATWVRTEEYWRRTPWAGRRALDGVPVVDGAVTNPLAHAVATGLAIAGATGESDVAGVRLDLYRANDIEADDTSSLVVDLADGGTLACALSLTAARRSEPCIVVEGTSGRLVLWYTLDVIQLFEPDAAFPVTTGHPRTGLLANLVDHVVDGTPLLVPADSTGAFMRVLEAVRIGPAPTRIAADVRRPPRGCGGDPPGRAGPRVVERARRRRGAHVRRARGAVGSEGLTGGRRAPQRVRPRRQPLRRGARTSPPTRVIMALSSASHAWA